MTSQKCHLSQGNGKVLSIWKVHVATWRARIHRSLYMARINTLFRMLSSLIFRSEICCFQYILQMQKQLIAIQLLPFKNISDSTTLFQPKGEYKKTENKLPMYFYQVCLPPPPRICAHTASARKTPGLLFMFRCSWKHQTKNNLSADNMSHFAFREGLKTSK